MKLLALAVVAGLAGLSGAAHAQQIGGGGGGGGGGVTFPLAAPNGSSAAPSYSFSGGTTSGMYASSNGNLDIAGGVITLHTPSSGTFQFNDNFADPGFMYFVGSTDDRIIANTANATMQLIANGTGSVTLRGGNTSGSVNLTPGGSGSINLNTNSGGSSLADAGGGAGAFHLAGLINTALGAAGNGADTTEDTLQSYSLPASSLDIVGRCVRITAWGTLAANADTKTIRVYFGASVMSSGGVTASGVNWLAHLLVCKTGSSTQSVVGDMLVGTTVITPYVNAGSDTDTSSITLKTTGQAGTANANDIVNKGQLVEYLS